MRIKIIPCLKDNYSYLIIDEKNKNKIISENKTSDSNNLSENKKDFSQETSINQNKNSENKN